MKKLILFPALIISLCALEAQAGRTEVLRDLEKSQAANQQVTATLKASSRLFGDKNDLISVILIIPSGSAVSVLGSDDTFLHVVFDEIEGYILARHAVIDRTPVAASSPAQQAEPVQQQQQQQQQQHQQQQNNRFSYLENKYGTGTAVRLYEGKIWKGMSAEMVKDSWGNPKKMNRLISGNNIREEWVYNNSWLFIQNDRLVEWGPVRK
ncbi:MAG TPA: hypothetical protein VMW32_04245 [Bacteroidales bacterium]|nr:hypothetical protein [Bacteroidales bacterium]